MNHRYSRWLLVGALAALPLLGRAQATPEVRALAKEGAELHNADRFVEADAKYQQALKLDPGNPDVKHLIALNYYRLGRYNEVTQLCQEIIAADAKAASPSVYQVYGVSLNALKRPAEAVKVYQQGLKQHPDANMLYFNLGTALYKLQRVEEAVDALRHAAQLDPQHPTSPLYLGLLAADGGQRIPAVLQLARYLVLEPEGERAATNLKRLDQLLQRGVKQTGEQNVTISLTESMVKDAKRGKGEDNFASLDMLLTLDGALDYDEKNKGKAPAERFAEKMQLICKSLGEKDGKASHKGFVWEFYAPYFAELERAGYGPAFAYLIRSSAAPNQPEVQQWLAAHSSQVADFKAWSAAYAWPK
jgi:tetratricopeptide (TPR) repeat protein